jgi:hypothetical protein
MAIRNTTRRRKKIIDQSMMTNIPSLIFFVKIVLLKLLNQSTLLPEITTNQIN